MLHPHYSSPRGKTRQASIIMSLRELNFDISPFANRYVTSKTPLREGYLPPNAGGAVGCLWLKIGRPSPDDRMAVFIAKMG
jgi:hypothetical protein